MDLPIGSLDGNYNLTADNWQGGKKIFVNVNQTIGGKRDGDVTDVALRTGVWPTGTVLQVDVGSSGVLTGAGGDGGRASQGLSNDADNGSNGTSALGVEYAATINNNGGEAAYADLTQVNSGGMSCDGNFIPGFDNGGSHLGTSSRRWVRVYAGDGSINTSDETLKQDITTLTTAELNAAKRLSKLFVT